MRPKTIGLPGFLIFLLFTGFLYALAVNAYYVGFFNDDAFYLIGARSLLQGRYVELNQPGTPPLINYTVGYPLLLVPVAALFSDAARPAQLLSFLFLLV